MIKYDRSLIAFAVCLSTLAGYVDALGFLSLGGFFVSFMSGNSTRFAVAIATGADGQALRAACIIALFVIGVVAGTLVSQSAGARGSPAVLALVTMLLVAGAACHELGRDLFGAGLTILAMGAENAIFQRDGEVSIGLTYMTGTLVKMGTRFANALMGGPRWIWMRYFLLWFGLLCGAVMGALVYAHVGLRGLWFAALAAACLVWPSSRFKPAT